MSEHTAEVGALAQRYAEAVFEGLSRTVVEWDRMKFAYADGYAAAQTRYLPLLKFARALLVMLPQDNVLTVRLLSGEDVDELRATIASVEGEQACTHDHVGAVTALPREGNSGWYPCLECKRVVLLMDVFA